MSVFVVGDFVVVASDFVDIDLNKYVLYQLPIVHKRLNLRQLFNTLLLLLTQLLYLHKLLLLFLKGFHLFKCPRRLTQHTDLLIDPLFNLLHDLLLFLDHLSCIILLYLYLNHHWLLVLLGEHLIRLNYL